MLTIDRATLMASAVSIDPRGELRMGTPRELFDIRATSIVPQLNVYRYAPHPDGRRVLVNALADDRELIINVTPTGRKRFRPVTLPDLDGTGFELAVVAFPVAEIAAGLEALRAAAQPPAIQV